MRLFDIMRNPELIKKHKRAEEQPDEAKEDDSGASTPVPVLMKEFVETLSSLFCGSTNTSIPFTGVNNNNSNSDNTGNIKELSVSKDRGFSKKYT